MSQSAMLHIRVEDEIKVQANEALAAMAERWEKKGLMASWWLG